VKIHFVSRPCGANGQQHENLNSTDSLSLSPRLAVFFFLSLSLFNSRDGNVVVTDSRGLHAAAAAPHAPELLSPPQGCTRENFGALKPNSSTPAGHIQRTLYDRRRPSFS
jgi:hypothetical protein